MMNMGFRLIFNIVYAIIYILKTNFKEFEWSD